MNNTKKTISCFLAVASITSVTVNVDNITKANNDVKVTTEPTQETGKVSAIVLETEQGAVIRVTAHTDVQKVKTTYTVDGSQAKVVNFGNLTKGQVKEIQINFGTQAPAVKTVKTLPNTAVVSDRVKFAETVKSHAIKGSVSFEYATTEVAATAPVATTKPTDSVTPAKPVDTVKPTKPVDVTKPAEPVTPVDTTKPTEPAKPVKKPTTPVGMQPKDEPTTPKEDNGTWREETRTRTVTVDEEYTENKTEDVFETKQLSDQWLDIVDQDGKLLRSVGWSDDYTDDQISDMVLALTNHSTQAQSHEYRKVRETKKVKVGIKTVPVTKVRKVQKQETYTVWVNSKTGEVRTTKPKDPAKPVEKPTTPKEDNGTWREETRTRNITVDEEYTENTTEDVFETKQLKERWIMVAKNDGTILANVGWESDVTQSEIDDALIQYNADKTIEEERVRETKKVKVGTKTVPVTKVRKAQKQETYTVWVNSKTGEVRTERP